MEDDYVRCPICQFPMCDEHCVSGLEHKKVCEYLRNKGSVVVNMDKSNPIYDVVLPLKILALKKSAPERYALVTQFMDHKSERFKFEDYWILIKKTIVDVILDLPGIPEDTTEEDILRIIGLLDTNSHEIHNRNGIAYKGMFPIGALLSHRCIVNSRQIMIKYTPFQNSCRYVTWFGVGILHRQTLKRINCQCKNPFFLLDPQFLFQKVQRFSRLTFGLTYLLVGDVDHSVTVGISPAHVFDAAIRLKWAL